MLTLDGNCLEMVIAWQRGVGRRELCAFLAIDSCGGQQVLRLTNHSGLPGAFEISRSEEQVVRAAARQRGWEIVAFLHTHPDHDAAMSPRDARCFAHDTLPWVIVGTPTCDPHQRTYPRRREDYGAVGSGLAAPVPVIR